MRLIITILFLVWGSLSAYGQLEIRGYVLGSDRVGIPGVTVLIAETPIGASTDSDGFFSLRVSKEEIEAISWKDLTIVISNVGWSVQNIEVPKNLLDLEELENTTVQITCLPTGGEVEIISQTSTGSSTDLSPVMMPRFPWPPPRPSARYVLPAKLFAKPKQLKDLDEKLIKALGNAGYSDRAYYTVPNGFVLITRVEQIKATGESLPSDQRWVPMDEPQGSFDLSSYLKALVFPQLGYYRIIAFAVTNQPFTSDGKSIGAAEINVLFDKGLNILPKPIGELPYKDDYHCTALIYVFEKREVDGVKLKLPSPLPGNKHLVRARILPLIP